MAFVKFKLKYCFLFFILGYLFSASAIYAVSVKTQISGRTLYLGDELIAEIKVDGVDSNARLIFPSVSGLYFEQLGPPSQSSQTTIINGKKTSFSGLVYQIAIIGEKKGVFNIPAFKINWQGKNYTGESFKIRVIDSSNQNSMLLKIEFSKEEIFIQQPLDITLKWYISEPISDYRLRFPLLNLKDEFDLELLKQGNKTETTNLNIGKFEVPAVRYNETYQGIDYTVYSIKFRIYPKKPGNLNLKAASVKAAVQRGTKIEEDFFGRRYRRAKTEQIFARSKDKVILIKALPETGKPANFTNAIGNYKLKLSSSEKRVKVGDPFEISIEIEGDGLLNQIERPLISQLEEFKKDFIVVENLEPGEIKGNKIIFKQVLRAKNEAVTQIPPVPFSYFNLEKEKYLTALSNSLPLKVLATETLKDSDIVANSLSVSEKKELAKIKKGIEANYYYPDALEPQSVSWLWVGWIIFPPLIYFSFVFYQKRKLKFGETAAFLRARNAEKKYNKRLKICLKQAKKDVSNFALEAGKTVNNLIEDKFDLGYHSLTIFDLEQLIKENKISKETGKELVELNRFCDRLNFSNQTNSLELNQNFLEKYTSFLKRLPKKLLN